MIFTPPNDNGTHWVYWEGQGYTWGFLLWCGRRCHGYVAMNLGLIIGQFYCNKWSKEVPSHCGLLLWVDPQQWKLVRELCVYRDGTDCICLGSEELEQNWETPWCPTRVHCGKKCLLTEWSVQGIIVWIWKSNAQGNAHLLWSFHHLPFSIQINRDLEIKTLLNTLLKNIFPSTTICLYAFIAYSSVPSFGICGFFVWVHTRTQSLVHEDSVVWFPGTLGYSTIPFYTAHTGTFDKTPLKDLATIQSRQQKRWFPNLSKFKLHPILFRPFSP